jgi:hypothetical protein
LEDAEAVAVVDAQTGQVIGEDLPSSSTAATWKHRRWPGFSPSTFAFREFAKRRITQ